MLVQVILHRPRRIELILRRFQQRLQTGGIGGFTGQQAAGDAIGVEQAHQHLPVHALGLFQALELVYILGTRALQLFHIASPIPFAILVHQHTGPSPYQSSQDHAHPDLIQPEADVIVIIAILRGHDVGIVQDVPLR